MRFFRSKAGLTFSLSYLGLYLLSGIYDVGFLLFRPPTPEFDPPSVAGRARLRIIHGHGKGILRKSLHELFASHPHVEKFYPAASDEGGTGATIVELKV